MPRRTLVVTATLLLLGTAAVVLPAQAGTTASPSDVITIDANSQGAPLTKAGLGTLFGVASTPDTPVDLITGSQVYLSEHQAPQGDPHFPTSTEAVAGKLRGTGVLMDGRYNDLMGGFPYTWTTLATWLSEVDSATRGIQSYKDELYGIAPFNEPDNKLQGVFMTDPTVQGSTYDDRFDWVWTQTVRRIRAIDPTVRIIGPNYEHYNPWEAADRQPRMRAFLVNAVNTGTVPNIIGWHSLGASPGDVPESLTRYYRPLEQELHVPGAPLPVSIEEYGPGTGDFEGVPGTMVKHWAEFARFGVTYATMGVYTNPGLLGNSLRRVYAAPPVPNGGWYMMSWFKSLRGNALAVSRWDTRHYQAADGVATWDPGARSITALVGGEDNDVDVKVLGVAARGLGTTVRVRLDDARWTTDPGATDKTVEHGGDPQTGPYNLFDKTMTVAADGSVTVPIHRMARYDGYRVVITAAGATTGYPTRYEAEAADRTHVTVHSGADGVNASGGSYIGGIDYADSALTFHVTAPATGIYTLSARYADGLTAPATHTVTVNGVPQEPLAYAPTAGWSTVELSTAVSRVRLTAGTNTIRLAKGNGYAEVDAIDVRPDTHRYEAEAALVTDARLSTFDYDFIPGYAGQLDNADSAVDFTVEAPTAGRYTVNVGYANGTASVATHQVLVNGVAAATVSYPPTGSWLDDPTQDRAERQASVAVTLNAVVNHVKLQKATGYTELDYLTILVG